MNRLTHLPATALLIGWLTVSACDGLWGPPPPQPVHHTVVRGDTLSKLAQRHQTTVDQLQSWNGLSSDRIDIGQELIVGYTGDAPPEAAPPPTRTPRKKGRRSPKQGHGTASTTPSGLSLPPEQPCKAGPSIEDGGDEPAFAGSEGLSHADVRSAMNAFLPTLQRCIEGDWPVGTLDLAITVACTGRVSAVQVQKDGGLDAALVSCITDTLRYAPFPAHDLPDGETFTYPMVFSQ